MAVAEAEGLVWGAREIEKEICGTDKSGAYASGERHCKRMAHRFLKSAADPAFDLPEFPVRKPFGFEKRSSRAKRVDWIVITRKAIEDDAPVEAIAAPRRKHLPILNVFLIARSHQDPGADWFEPTVMIPCLTNRTYLLLIIFRDVIMNTNVH